MNDLDTFGSSSIVQRPDVAVAASTREYGQEPHDEVVRLTQRREGCSCAAEQAKPTSGEM